MTKEQAIDTIREIQQGSGINRGKYPIGWIGNIPREEWGNGLFVLGMEYGYILALLDAFDITVEEVELS